jgi:Fe-S cluster assembly protein SufD
LGQKDQLVDHHTLMDHRQPNCNSHEYYHGILTDQSRGVFNGKIYVHQIAQKTDAIQNSRNLVLSDSATINAKPQLEIYADDVRCTHGATIGQLDEDSVFYLRARGINEALARRMLIHAFASDVVDRIPFDPVKDYLEEILADRFDAKD